MGRPVRCCFEGFGADGKRMRRPSTPSPRLLSPSNVCVSTWLEVKDNVTQTVIVIVLASAPMDPSPFAGLCVQRLQGDGGDEHGGFRDMRCILRLRSVHLRQSSERLFSACPCW